MHAVKHMISGDKMATFLTSEMGWFGQVFFLSLVTFLKPILIMQSQ